MRGGSDNVPMPDDPPEMTESQLLRHMLDRQALYFFKPNVHTLQAFFAGYSVACAVRKVEPPVWDKILDEVRTAVAPKMAHTSLTLDMILDRVYGADDHAAYTRLMHEIRKRLPPVP